MHIVADENMPWVEELFSAFGTVTRLPGRSIRSADLRHAEVLLVRSVTRVDRTLLDNTPVGFVGSATIGTDHVDCEFLQERGIAFSNAPGCNADAVVNYVLASLCTLQPDWLAKTLAIVGCGNVGGRLYRCLRALGVRCRVYDPFLAPDSNRDLVTFEAALGANIICLHTPLTGAGPSPTAHMFDRQVLSRLEAGTLILNAGRGPVVDNRALRDILAAGSDLQAVLDVWETEPAIDTQLLSRVALGTPHIAGYSQEGKVNGTAMVCEAFCRWLGVAAPTLPRLPDSGEIFLDKDQGLTQAVLAAYPILEDSRRLRRALLESNGPLSSVAVGRAFDQLRRDYPQRREFSSYRVAGADGAELAPGLVRQLGAVGFQVPGTG